MCQKNPKVKNFKAQEWFALAGAILLDMKVHKLSGTGLTASRQSPEPYFF